MFLRARSAAFMLQLGACLPACRFSQTSTHIILISGSERGCGYGCCQEESASWRRRPPGASVPGNGDGRNLVAAVDAISAVVSLAALSPSPHSSRAALRFRSPPL